MGGEGEIVYAGRNTAKQFLYNHVFSFPRKESSGGEGRRGGGVEERRRIYMRASFQACVGGACL